MWKADDILKKNILKVFSSSLSDSNQNVRPHWSDGTPAHTIYTIGNMDEYDLSKGEIPLTTLRPVAWKTAIKEILWIYQDQSNDVNFLKEKYNVQYWDSWMNDEGNLGKAYAYQIAKKTKYSEGEFNQMERVLYLLENDPMNRRIMTNMIDIEETPDMTLVPCAFLTMWTVNGKKLDMTLIQRSNDLVAAQSINAFQYAMLLKMVANATGYQPGVFRHFIQNMHIYDRHMIYANEMINRESIGTPKICMNDVKDFWKFSVDDFKVYDYYPNPQIENIPIAI